MGLHCSNYTALPVYKHSMCTSDGGVTDHASMKYMQFCFAESPVSFRRDAKLRFGMKIEQKEEYRKVPYALCS